MTEYMNCPACGKSMSIVSSFDNVTVWGCMCLKPDVLTVATTREPGASPDDPRSLRVPCDPHNERKQ